MISLIKNSILGIAFLAIPFNNGLAQPQKKVGGLEIVSKPRGVTIVISGEVELATIAPCNITQDIVGNIKVKATHPGYETWKSEMILLPNRDYTLNIEMKPRTRFKAAIRSMFIPGWGQFYSRQRSRGVLMGLASAGGITAALLVNDYCNRKYDEYLDAETDFDLAQSISIEERRRLRDILDLKQREAYDAETTKRTYLGIAIGLWAYNILDAIVFFPDYKRNFLNRSYPSLQSAIIGDAPGIVITANF